MRRFVLAVVLPLLTLACASQPQPQPLRGSYAVVLDPAFTPRESVQISPLLHQRVHRALEHRLQLASSVDAADTVVVLEPSDRPGYVRYQIRRGGTEVTSYAAIGPIAKSTKLSVADELQLQRQNERKRANIDYHSSDEFMRRVSGPKMDHDLHLALGRAAGRVVNQIVKDLTNES